MKSRETVLQVAALTQEPGVLPLNGKSCRAQALPATAKTELSLFPTPANPYLYIDYRANPDCAGAPAMVEIFNASGQLVWSETNPETGACNRATWKGTDENGRALPGGDYWVQIRMKSRELKQNFLLVR